MEAAADSAGLDVEVLERLCRNAEGAVVKTHAGRLLLVHRVDHHTRRNTETAGGFSGQQHFGVRQSPPPSYELIARGARATGKGPDGLVYVLTLHDLTGGSGHEEVGDDAILGRQEVQAILAVPVEHPAGEQQSRALVSLAEALPSDPVSEYGRGLDDVVDAGDCVQGALDAVEIVRLVEPLALTPL